MHLPCGCALRAVFRACYARFRDCEQKDRLASKATLAISAGGRRRSFRWERKNEDYIADFYLLSKRSLTEPVYWALFKLHFLEGKGWKDCCRFLRISRATFFHAVYRIEERLGHVFRETRPYALYPTHEYFATIVRAGIAA